MSEGNVEISLRAIAAAFAQPPDMETVNEVSGPDLVVTTNWGVDAAEHRGMRGFLDALGEMSAAFEPWQQEVERIIDAGEDRGVALMRLTARGKESGVPVQFRGRWSAGNENESPALAGLCPVPLRGFEPRFPP